MEPVSYAAVEEDGTSGLVIEVFMTRIRLVLILCFFMVAHKAECQTLSKAFLKSMKTCLAGAGDISHRECSVAWLFFRDDLLGLWLQSLQYDLRHDFAWVTDKVDHSVVLTLLQIAFLGKCDD